MATPPPDSAQIDNAILAVLAGDATLHGLMPDGVYFDEGLPNMTRFVIVSRITAISLRADQAVFRSGLPQDRTRRAIEDYYYLVLAKMSGTSGVPADQAAARIDALLEDQPLTAPGYSWMTTHRIEAVRSVDVDDTNTAIRWQHRGGRYRVQMAVL